MKGTISAEASDRWRSPNFLPSAACPRGSRQKSAFR
jgi:hypothetical protein